MGPSLLNRTVIRSPNRKAFWKEPNVRRTLNTGRLRRSLHRDRVRGPAFCQFYKLGVFRPVDVSRT